MPAPRSVVLFIGLMCAPSMVAGQTFKGGQVSWQASDALTIEFSLQGTWRRDAYSTANGRCISLVTLLSVPCSGADGFPESGDVIAEAEANTTFDPGDGTGAIGSPFGPLLYLITSVDDSNNLVSGFALNPASLPVAELTVAHTYSTAGVYRAFVDGFPRMGTVEGNVNNGDQAFRLETLVNVGTAELASPLAGSAPVVLCGIDEVCSFPIAAFDRSGDGLQFRMSTDFEAGTLGTFLQPGPPHSTFPATIDPGGVYEWDTTLASLAPDRTFYSTQVTIESLTPPITGTIPPPVTGPIDITDTIASKVALDFLIELVSASGTPPDFEPGPIGTVTETRVGKTVNMVVSASDVDDGQTLTMNAHGLPRGAEIRLNQRGKSGVIAAHLRWKPDPDQVGDHLITFVVNDSGQRQRFGSLAITVEAREDKEDKKDKTGK